MVPPQVSSTSSGCGAIASRSSFICPPFCAPTILHDRRASMRSVENHLTRRSMVRRIATLIANTVVEPWTETDCGGERDWRRKSVRGYGWEKRQFLALRFCRSRRKGSELKNLSGPLHTDRGGCTLSVDRELKMGIPVQS